MPHQTATISYQNDLNTGTMEDIEGMFVCHSRETNFVSEKDWRVWEIPSQSTDDVMTLKAPCDVCDSSSDDSLTNQRSEVVSLYHLVSAHRAWYFEKGDTKKGTRCQALNHNF